MGKPLIDLTGQVFGDLTVIKRAPNKYGRTAWYCECSCGKKDISYTSCDLRQGKVVSCGCKKRQRAKEVLGKNKIDVTGQHFGRLTVLEDDGTRTNAGKVLWKCQCECGNITYVTSAELRSGHTKSCGCYKRELASKIEKDLIGQRFGRLLVTDKIFRENETPHTLWICKCDCGNTITSSSKSLLYDDRKSCGCLKSKGESLLQKIFQENNIEYETQKSFETCRFPNTNYLAKFDFYLPDKDLLIEYDGIQHFEETSWKELEKVQKRDSFKNKWCKENNKKLLRIPYTDLNILDYNYLRRKIDEIISS